jgi:hypothetical protein
MAGIVNGFGGLGKIGGKPPQVHGAHLSPVSLEKIRLSAMIYG